MRDSQHTQNTQINEVIDENEERVIYFMEKSIWAFWPTQYTVMEDDLTLGGGHTMQYTIDVL